METLIFVCGVIALIIAVTEHHLATCERKRVQQLRRVYRQYRDAGDQAFNNAHELLAAHQADLARRAAILSPSLRQKPSGPN